MDSYPIKELQGLLDDPEKVLEKISRIQSALNSMTTHLPPAPIAEGTSTAEGEAAPRRGPMGDDPVYGRLLQALHEMQSQIEDRIQPLTAEIVRQEVERLRDQSDEYQISLKNCLAEIDQSILNCFARMDEYQRRSADLAALNHRLVDLGAAPEPLPPVLAAINAADSIVARLEGLRLAGKI